MDGLTVFKRAMKYEFCKFPLWCWILLVVFAILLRHQIAQIGWYVLPVLAALAAYYHFTDQKMRMIAVAFMITGLVIMIAVF